MKLTIFYKEYQGNDNSSLFFQWVCFPSSNSQEILAPLRRPLIKQLFKKLYITIYR